MSPAASFAVPSGREAAEPPEQRGLRRDGVRLLIARPDGIAHARFDALPDHLAPGDLLVVNTSATLPAAVEARLDDGGTAHLHVSTELDDGRWVVEIRSADGSGPDRRLGAGTRMRLPGGLRLDLEHGHPDPDEARPRLRAARLSDPTSVSDYLPRFGRPIGYRYLHGSFPLADRQNVFAREPGSAEMPSAGRPFTDRLLVRLMARGVVVAPVVLHAGVSSPELHEPPQPERYDVPRWTAEILATTRRSGRRVVAVGTTVTRALETAVERDGLGAASSGWTRLVLGPDRPARVVDGLVTGLHPPEASHLLLLEAVAGPELVGRAYEEAVAGPYLWHEFGDSMLFLP